MKHNPELKAALQQHFQEEVAPVMTQIQSEFDGQLSQEELQFIQAKRTEAAELHQRGKALRKEFKEAREKGASKEELKERMRGKKKVMHQDKRALAESLSDFMERNTEEIDQAMEAFKPYKEEWRKQRKTIIQEYRSADVPEMEDQKEKNRRPHRRHWDEKGDFEGDKMRRGKRGGKGHRKGDGPSKGVVKFLLWNGQAAGAEVRSGEVDLLKPTLQQNFPNPATDLTTIVFSLPQASKKVILNVTDVKGKLVKQQVLNNLDKGQHQVELDVADWSEGTYFYTLEASGFATTKKMMVTQ